MLVLSPVLRQAIRYDIAASQVRQYEYAFACGIPPAKFSSLLNGALPVRADDERIKRLAEAVGVPFSEALSPVPQMAAVECRTGR